MALVEIIHSPSFTSLASAGPASRIGPAVLAVLALACSSAGGKGAPLTGTGNKPGTSLDGGSESSVPDAKSPGLRDEPDNPCESDDPPKECFVVPTGPACGDAELNQPSEDCDDGNGLPGDGCSGVCKVEAYFECPTPGEPCISTIVCGDGALGPGEACDDGNRVGSDGCSETCNLVEPGYACRTPGADCERVYICGDGVVDPVEGCDDGNADPGDGCDEKCRMEMGFKCEGQPSTCSATICGDGITEGAESCDDGNTMPFDGCSAACRSEPDCSAGACVSSCGDGIVLGEECDDGNLRDGDGCSSSCRLESGFECNNTSGACERINDICTMRVPVVFRDFNASHPDFQPPGTSEGQTGLVEERLDADGKPVYSGAANGNIQSAASFVEWYRDSASSSTVVDSLILWQNEDGGYVNRYGANGEQYLHVDFDTLAWCGPAGSNCSDPQCADANYPTCFDPCTPWNQPESACGGAILTFDGNPLFFPLDGAPEALLDPEGRFTAQIPPEYGGNWDTEEGAPLHDFHFTTEVRYWFKYEAAASATLDFTGDDDVWVFVNGVLALDLGGWHPPLSGSLTLDSASASRFGLVDGSVYQIAVFHAERQTNGSSFRLTLSGFNMAPSDCTTACGDGQLAPGEECDDGVALNTGDYNMCSPACTLGPRCGDGITQEQFGEACDNGVNDGAYGECAPNCQIGPHCGDGIVQPEKEQCDDGINDGGYGECAEHCVLGPYCGDGTLNLPEEECDDGNNEDFDTCSAACRDEIIML